MRIHWSRRAIRDLRHARDYVARDNPRAARRVGESILTAAESLAELPARGRPGRVFGTRELVVRGTPYLIVYRVREETVQIARVLHGAQRWPD